MHFYKIISWFPAIFWENIEKDANFFKKITRSSHPEVFLVKGVLKICSKFTGEHPCRSVISIKLLCNFIEIALRHGCSPVNLLHIFRTPFTKNTSRWLLLIILTMASFVKKAQHKLSLKRSLTSEAPIQRCS